jgi:hypothetical protein
MISLLIDVRSQGLEDLLIRLVWKANRLCPVGWKEDVIVRLDVWDRIDSSKRENQAGFFPLGM